MWRVIYNQDRWVYIVLCLKMLYMFLTLWYRFNTVWLIMLCIEFICKYCTVAIRIEISNGIGDDKYTIVLIFVTVPGHFVLPWWDHKDRNSAVRRLSLFVTVMWPVIKFLNVKLHDDDDLFSVVFTQILDPATYCRFLNFRDPLSLRFGYIWRTWSFTR